MTKRERSYTLGSVISEGIDKRLLDVHTAMPGRIVRYDESKQLADVKPLVQITYYDEAGEARTESLPVVPDCPVLFPCAGGFRITFPIKAGDQDGDTVALLISEVSIDKWLESGGNDVDPLDERRFHLTDGMCLLGLNALVRALSSAPLDRMTIGKDTGVQIHIDGTNIKIGDNDPSNLDTVALGSVVASALASIASKLSSHTHVVPGVTPGMGSVTSNVSLDAAPSIDNVQSSVVYVKK